MFKIQKKILYAIEAVVDISINSGTQPVQNVSIAQRQGIPKRYLEQTLQKLVQKRILVGSRGPKGGYRLSREKRKVTVSDIIEAVCDGDQIYSEHTSELSKKVIQPLINKISHKFLSYFSEITVSELCEIAKKQKVQKNSQRKVDFVI